jgi:predicted Ser/Thr protein kinase
VAEALTKAGRYLIVGELGRGSMGVVYKGFDPIIGRTVAIKTMLPQGVSQQEFEEYKARFQREAQAAGVLAHPNIITVYDFGEDNGVLYLAMEFLEGKSLEAVVQEQTILSIETILPIYDQVCGALDHAHQHKIVHRDVKPANIMILQSGLVKVTDFGIAKMMSMGMTQAGQVLGTPNYMSPEQVKGRSIDGRSDIFALGVILYELVTGEKPFGGLNITTVIYKIINENPIPPRELDASIHAGLSYVITKALAKNVDERYQTCAELAQDLRNYRNLGGVVPGQGTLLMKASPVRVEGAEPAPLPAAPPAQESGSYQIPSGPAAGPGSSMLKAPPIPAEAVEPAPIPWAPPTPPAAPRQTGVRAIGDAPIASSLNVHDVPLSAPRQQSIPQVAWVLGALVVVAILGVLGYLLVLRPKPQLQLPPATPQVVTTPSTPTTPAEHGATGGMTGNVGQLAVNANVKGAKISVDGRTDPNWLTPYTIPNLSAGNHTVTISGGGYGEYRQSVRVEGGKTASIQGTLSASQTPPPTTNNPGTNNPPEPKPVVGGGQLTVSANVAGAKISIDDRSQPGWVTPYTISGLSAGPHNVVISMDGYDNFTQSVTVASGQTITVVGNLSAPRAELDIVTIPKGFEVIIDGKSYGLSPVSALLPIGNHTYAVKQPGSEPEDTVYKLTSGIHKITVTLGEAMATGIVEVRTTPPGATVTADGARISGQTPASFRLAVGTHTLVISMAGYLPQQQQITVSQNATTPVSVQLNTQ